MKLIYVCLIGLLSGLTDVYSQNTNNLTLEKIDKRTGYPVGMQFFPADQLGNYTLQVDSTVKTQGIYSFSIAANPAKSGHTYIASSFTVPGNYSGAKVQLKGFLKTENVGASGFAGLWMRIDGEDGTLAYDNMASRKIVGTNDWKEYTIELPLSDKAEKINIGAILDNTTGKIWFDQLSLFVDGIEIEKATPRPAIVYKAKSDTSFEKSSGVSLPSLSSKQVADFQLLGQIWGFLKYYHPFIAKGNVQWDNELFRFLPSYIKASNSKARDQLLLEWINQWGPPDPCPTCVTEVKEFSHLKPDLAWMEKLKGTKLYEPLQQILKNRNQGSHYYIALTRGVSNPIFKNEKTYSIDYPDTGVRLLALYRYWNMIQYFFPYKNIIGEDWNAVLSEFIPKFIEAKDKLAYRLVVLELISRINDTHANLVEDTVLRNYRGRRIAPVQVKFIEEKLVVTDYYHPAWGQKSGLKPGDIITSIQDKPIEKIVKEKLKYTSASNYPVKQRNMARGMLRSNAEQLQVEIKRDDVTSSKSLQLFPLDSIKTSIDGAYRMPDSCYRFLSKDIGYIYLGNIKASLLPRIFLTFANTKGIVFDIRNYPSEFIVFSMTKYLLGEEKEFVKFNGGTVNYPGLFNWTGRPKIGGKNDDYYKGKIVILVNEITQSQAEYTTMALRTANNATVIGSTTAGADGNVSAIVLPGNLTSRITGIGVFYPDGKETQRIGILPDEVVKPTIKGIKENRDELLERAISIINQVK
ncbi:hypothetical protein WSM22_39310 [Cytophagales bacterium WSM2-2]|nr:hypothetical protein WSM22_39310 [Cytophagales bacterium WSM2-2]